MKPLLLLALFAGCSGPKPDAGMLADTLPLANADARALGSCAWEQMNDGLEEDQKCVAILPDGMRLVLGQVLRRANNEPLEAYVYGQTCGSGEFRTVDEAKRCVEGTLLLQKGDEEVSKPWYEFNPEVESIDQCRDRRLMQMPALSSAEMEVLRQCRSAVWDGNVASKSARTSLLQKGLICKFNGWQVITREGLAILETLGELRS